MPVEIVPLSRRDIGRYVELLGLGFGEELGHRGTDFARVGRAVHMLLSYGRLPMRLVKLLTGWDLFVLAAMR